MSSQRQSRQAKHIQSIQKIFTEYDDKLLQRSASPQPISPYPSSRFAIHRTKSPNGAHNKQSPRPQQLKSNSLRALHVNDNTNINNHHQMADPLQPLQKSKSLNTSDMTSPVLSIGSMFDTNKKSSIADLHRNNLLSPNDADMEDDDDEFHHNISIPRYNTSALLKKYESDSQTLNELCTNFGAFHQSFSKIIREQNMCINNLLHELDKKNNQIKQLKKLLKSQSNAMAMNHHHNQHQHHMHHPPPPTPQYNINNVNNINYRANSNPLNGKPMNRRFQQHINSAIKIESLDNGPIPNTEYEEIIGHVPV